MLNSDTIRLRVDSFHRCKFQKCMLILHVVVQKLFFACTVRSKFIVKNSKKLLYKPLIKKKSKKIINYKIFNLGTKTFTIQIFCIACNFFDL